MHCWKISVYMIKINIWANIFEYLLVIITSDLLSIVAEILVIISLLELYHQAGFQITWQPCNYCCSLNLESSFLFTSVQFAHHVFSLVLWNKEIIYFLDQCCSDLGNNMLRGSIPSSFLGLSHLDRLWDALNSFHLVSFISYAILLSLSWNFTFSTLAILWWTDIPTWDKLLRTSIRW